MGWGRGLQHGGGPCASPEPPPRGTPGGSASIPRATLDDDGRPLSQSPLGPSGAAWAAAGAPGAHTGTPGGGGVGARATATLGSTLRSVPEGTRQAVGWKGDGGQGARPASTCPETDGLRRAPCGTLSGSGDVCPLPEPSHGSPPPRCRVQRRREGTGPCGPQSMACTLAPPEGTGPSGQGHTSSPCLSLRSQVWDPRGRESQR